MSNQDNEIYSFENEIGKCRHDTSSSESFASVDKDDESDEEKRASKLKKKEQGK